MKRLTLDLTDSQHQMLGELAGQRSKAAVLRDLVDLAALIRDETAQGMTFALVDRDGVQHRVLGISLLLRRVDVSGSVLDEPL